MTTDEEELEYFKSLCTNREFADELTKKAMETMGYIVTVKDGWVVKIYKDNTVERISQL